MNKIKNYIAGSWIEGDGEELVAENAINGAAIGTVSSAGLDYAAMLDYGRSKGGPALRKMTFQERGRMLKALALHLMSIKKKFYELSAATGATKTDSWIDIEGGIGNLFANASLRRQFPDLPYAVEGDAVPLSKEDRSLATTYWFQNMAWRCISMPLTSQFGACSKKLL